MNSNRKVSYRVHGRLFAVKFLYQFVLDNDSQVVAAYTQDKGKGIQEQIESFKDSYTSDDNEHSDNELPLKSFVYGTRFVHGIIENFDQLQNTIKPLLKTGDMGRLPQIEKSILYVSAYEILNEIDVPKKVTIDEAVKMAKAYSGEEGYKFINGVLDGLTKD